MYSAHQRNTQRDSGQIPTHTQGHTYTHINIGNITRWTSHMVGSTTLVSYFFGRGVGDSLSCILRINTVIFSSEETRYS